MKELLRTTDLVRLSFLQALLRDAGIEPIVLDGNMSVLEGSANAIPRRLAVSSDDYDRACRVLEESGEHIDTD
ncbi:MAG: DUF2007 domain-containing protein [Rhodospirillaceae bacterium]|jgi:hypothetical protein|nr:DUF2007 domain-containing protein [Rhodospirillaceae bacterium]MBT6136826.1 DUF2007 domain-containing protein [Rhodospirillaceae bacterium]